MDGINFYQGHIFAFSKRLLWLFCNLQLTLVKPFHAHHGHIPGDDDDDGDDCDDNDVDYDDDGGPWSFLCQPKSCFLFLIMMK